MTTPIFNFEKTIQVILLVANKLERKDFHKIFKIIYFADRDHMSKYGRVITGDIYVAMDDGPVPTKIYDIFKSLRGDSFFSDNAYRFRKYFDVKNNHFLDPKMDADLDYLSESDIEILNSVLSKYAEMPWGEIREISHDYAWRNTSKDRDILLSDIMLESGDDKDYIDFVTSNIELQKICL